MISEQFVLEVLTYLFEAWTRTDQFEPRQKLTNVTNISISMEN